VVCCCGYGFNVVRVLCPLMSSPGIPHPALALRMQLIEYGEAMQEQRAVDMNPTASWD